MADTRKFDLVLYGASGFVGRQTVVAIARHALRFPQLRWAVAGRSRLKLNAALAAAVDVVGDSAADAGVLVADAHDSAALQALAASARIVLSSAGPFGLYGSELVAACVQQRTHYVDITGETPWVRGLIDRHHEQAQHDGTRIVPGCGFDSVPSDLGAWMLTREMQRRHHSPCVEVKASFSMKGGFNGGTVASLMHNLESGRDEQFRQPFLLNPAGSEPADVAPHADPFAPHHDRDFDAWQGPFLMGPINTRVVRRSAALWAARGDSGYGEGFRYQEYQHFGRGPAAALMAAGVSSGAALGESALALAPLRKLLGKAMPAPGEGPSEQAMDGGHFRCRLVGRDARGHVLRASISDQGDPGNRATTKMVCEAALALVHDLEQLPPEGGVLTPAAAFGDVLVQRLRAAGMHLEIDG